MIYVKVREHESFERAMLRFTKACEKDSTLAELREKMYYEKPSDKKRREKNLAYRKAKRMQKLSE